MEFVLSNGFNEHWTNWTMMLKIEIFTLWLYIKNDTWKFFCCITNLALIGLLWFIFNVKYLYMRQENSVTDAKSCSFGLKFSFLGCHRYCFTRCIEQGSNYLKSLSTVSCYSYTSDSYMILKLSEKSMKMSFFV